QPTATQPSCDQLVHGFLGPHRLSLLEMANRPCVQRVLPPRFPSRARFWGAQRYVKEKRSKNRAEGKSHRDREKTARGREVTCPPEESYFSVAGERRALTMVVIAL